MAPKEPKARATKAIFDKCEVALAGDLGKPQWKEADVARWTAAWGGVFSHKFDPETCTHLLATAEQWRDRGKVASLRRCQKHRAVHVVTPDWLEDSIDKRRRLDERPYSLREAQRERNARRRRGERVRKGIEEAESYVDTNRYHVYRDGTVFEYKIELTRDDKELGNVGQKYLLTIWESNSKPHLYHFTAKYWKKAGDRKPAVLRPSDTPQKLEKELAEFRKVFRKKTGLLWDERIAKAGTTGVDKFQYQPPKGGKPMGLVNGRPYIPSIFGDGTKKVEVVIPESSDDDNDGDDNKTSEQDKDPGSQVAGKEDELFQRLKLLKEAVDEPSTSAEDDAEDEEMQEPEDDEEMQEPEDDIEVDMASEAYAQASSQARVHSNQQAQAGENNEDEDEDDDNESTSLENLSPEALKTYNEEAAKIEERNAYREELKQKPRENVVIQHEARDEEATATTVGDGAHNNDIAGPCQVAGGFDIAQVEADLQAEALEEERQKAEEEAIEREDAEMTDSDISEE